ncbi:MAG: cytochrome c oxidase subunit II [Alphaproteobacteria bacterium]|nr:cytochrome c oxidase subunit II [Alphaproteobacteria bacterium]
MSARLRLLTLTSAVAALAVLTGCEWLTFSNEAQTTMVPMTDLGRSTDSVYWLVIYITAGIFVVVQGMLMYAMWRFKETSPDDIPEQVHGNLQMEIGWTLLPVIILVVISVPTVKGIWAAQPDTAEMEAAGEVVTIKVVGKQWWFAFQYPDYDDIVIGNEIHVPAGKQVHLELHTGDVLHSFWIPRLGGKRDLIPGKVNHIWFKADMPPEGQDSITLLGQCAELCGDSHALMRMQAVVHTPEDFDRWVNGYKASAAQSSDPLAAAGQQTFLSAGCIACHSTDPTNAQAYLAPNLSHFGSRTHLAADRLDNTPENLSAWLHNPQALKPGATMPNLNLNDQQVEALVAYLHSLK